MFQKYLKRKMKIKTKMTKFQKEMKQLIAAEELWLRCGRSNRILEKHCTEVENLLTEGNRAYEEIYNDTKKCIKKLDYCLKKS